MISIAPDEGSQILLMPLRKDQMKIEGRFLPAPSVENLVHYQEPHLVSEFQPFRRGRIVGGADRVASHLLQHLELPLGSAKLECRTQGAEVMMSIDAFDLDMLAVDVEPIWLKANGTNPKSRLVTVDWLSVLRDGCYGYIAVWLLLRRG